ncbi:MAG TPA: 3-hydroxyacyl-CoA dehydrogenase NAD-binding domain-containing protein [Bryobacteraceae bacterium]|nr:3-hydroxyacyl-CoA dehydrogenase NAD-binding domain-containing protein [Bryobacteraceae bacterium]
MASIQRVAVLGAGTMGSRIAAHFSNAGYPVLLLDLPKAGADPSAIARRGIETAASQKPVAFFVPENSKLIEPGNFNEDLPRVRDCQWVIEAVTESLEIKRSIWERVDRARHSEAILSTNTSGIPLHTICQGFPADFRKHFLGTHFFNPPRYLHLLEVIPGPDTDPSLLNFVSLFGEDRLGKGVVRCKDTPNFIANRIGSFWGAAVVRAMLEGDYTIEEVDTLTGALIGLPKSATFRLFDIIGLDVWAFVSKNLYENIADDPWRDWFKTPGMLQNLIGNRWLGEKTGQGFYKRVGPDKQIHAINWKTFEYHPASKPNFAIVEETRRIPDFSERLRALVSSTDRAGTFLWNVFKHVLLYSAIKVGEISDSIVEIDRAMRWGYGHKLGPFELWDALGFAATARRMESDGMELPVQVRTMLQANVASFYRAADHEGAPHEEYFDFSACNYRKIEEHPRVISLPATKRARGVVESNPGASLVDLGDGVLCLEFHSKMNAIGKDALLMMDRAYELLSGPFEGMVIANEGENFSVGANLVLLLTAAQAGDFDTITETIHHFQQCVLRMKYAPKPVVAAVFSRALGGGCEIVLQSHRVQASAETYIGLVEVAVGLIPAAGGCKECVIRFPKVDKAFETIGNAKVSGSAQEAKALGFLRDCDRISMNPKFLIGDAKQFVLELGKTYIQGAQRTDIAAGGEPAYARMRLAAWQLLESGLISEHDFTIGEKLAFILSGGRVRAGSPISEQNLLDLEREAFLSLLGMPKSQQRIEQMLKTGKPLRN